MGSFWLTGLSYMVGPRRTGVRDLSRSTILWQDLLHKRLVPSLVPARGALVACLTGLVTLTSTRIYDLHYSTYTRVPGSVSIHILRTVVLDYGELLAYWFILHCYVMRNFGTYFTGTYVFLLVPRESALLHNSVRYQNIHSRDPITLLSMDIVVETFLEIGVSDVLVLT